MRTPVYLWICTQPALTSSLRSRRCARQIRTNAINIRGFFQPPRLTGGRWGRNPAGNGGASGPLFAGAAWEVRQQEMEAVRPSLRGSSLESSATGNGGASGVLFAGAAWKVRQQGMEGRQAFSSSGNRAAPGIPAKGAQASYAQGRSGGRRKTRSGNARRANYRAQPGDLRLQVSAG